MLERDQTLLYEDAIADRLVSADLLDGVVESIALRIREER
jgi:hypothetical protein